MPGKKKPQKSNALKNKINALAKKFSKLDDVEDMELLGETHAMSTDLKVFYELTDLLSHEFNKKIPDQTLMDGYFVLFSGFVSNISLMEENDPQRSELLTGIQSYLLQASQTGKLPSEMQMILMQMFTHVGLDLSEELQEQMEQQILSSVNETESHFDENSSSENFEGPLLALLDELGGDIFQFADMLLEQTEILPSETAQKMAITLLLSEEEAVREAALIFLLNEKSSYRQVSANALGLAASEGKVTSVMLRRMIAMRNWLPAETSKQLDEAIKLSRKKEVQCAVWPQAREIREVRLSGIDGAGAQSLFVIFKEGRRHGVANILLKQDYGVRDAFIVHQLTLTEIRKMLKNVEIQMTLFNSNMEYVTTVLGQYIGINVQTGSLPPYALLDVAEQIGLSDMNPVIHSTKELVDELAIHVREHVPHAELNTSFENSVFWLDDPSFPGFSWFMEGDDIDKIASSDKDLEAKMRLAIKGPVEKKRERWARLFANMGMLLMYHDIETKKPLSDNESGWVDFILISEAMMNGHPLGKIPVMNNIAKESISGDFLSDLFS